MTTTNDELKAAAERSKDMTRKELVHALEKLLADTEVFAYAKGKQFCDPPRDDQLGNGHEHMAQIIRRLGSGQVVAISPRIIRMIITELDYPKAFPHD
jgi:hypothetical protein